MQYLFLRHSTNMFVGSKTGQKSKWLFIYIFFLSSASRTFPIGVVQLQLHCYTVAGRTQQGKGENTWYFVNHLFKTPDFSLLSQVAPLRQALVLWMDLCMLLIMWTYVQIIKQKQIFNFSLKQNFNFMYHLYYLLWCEKDLITSPRTDIKSRLLGQSYRYGAFPTGLIFDKRNLSFRPLQMHISVSWLYELWSKQRNKEKRLRSRRSENTI